MKRRLTTYGSLIGAALAGLLVIAGLWTLARGIFGGYVAAAAVVTLIVAALALVLLWGPTARSPLTKELVARVAASREEPQESTRASSQRYGPNAPAILEFLDRVQGFALADWERTLVFVRAEDRPPWRGILTAYRRHRALRALELGIRGDPDRIAWADAVTSGVVAACRASTCRGDLGDEHLWSAVAAGIALALRDNLPVEDYDLLVAPFQVSGT